LKKMFLAAVAVFAITTLASAADLPQQAAPQQPYYRPPPVVSPAYDWTGFYIGVMGGYGFSDNASVNGFAVTNAGLKGGFAGSTLGFNYQSGQFVFGVEDDFAWSGIGKTWPASFGVSVQDQMLAFGTITGRAGFAANNFLIYSKGGYAYMLNEISATGFGATAWERRYHGGWTVGAGLEYGFAGNWSAKLEYMFAQYLATPYVYLNGATLAADVHTVKAGINYRFGWGGQPVTARY
jgi:outer membrane immunogenic protein